MAARLPSASSSGRRLSGLLIAALVNGAWLLLLMQWVRHDKPRDEAQGRVEMRLWNDQRRVAAPRAARGPTARTPIAAPRSPLPEELAAAPSLSAASPAAPVNAPVEAPTAPAPLRLSLPPAERAASGPRPESMLSQMLNDPRATRPRRGVEYAVADAAGTLPVTVADSTDGTNSKLIRQGSKCVRVSEARIRTLHPIDESTKDVLGVVGPCSR